MSSSSQVAGATLLPIECAATERSITPKNEALFFVSVIIPVWNDPERLDCCLRALQTQTYPADSFEVIVVDNGSTKSLQHIVARYACAQLLHESIPGSYAARNRGLKHARGAVIAFTDADCVPAPDWIEKGVAHLGRDEGCSVVAGRIEVFPRVPQQPTAVEQYELLIAFAQREFVNKYRFGATANLFALKEVFERAGPFLAEVKSGGDLEWGRRAADYGYKLEYDDNVCVQHPARASLPELYSKIVRVTGGLHDLKRLNGRAYLEFDRSLVLELLPPVKAIAATMREPSLPQKRDRIKVGAVHLFVRYVQALEKVRLTFPKIWKRNTTR